MSNGNKINAGALVDSRELVTINAEPVRIPDPQRLVHLQFRRFAGCPVCNLHLHSIVQRHNEIVAAGIREVVVFHSSIEELLPHAGDLPFAVIADPDRRLYREFGVEAAAKALLDPRAWPAMFHGITRDLATLVRGTGRVPALNPHGGRLGLPADFLIANDGRVLACKYGEHAYDQWSVDEILALSRVNDSARATNEEVNCRSAVLCMTRNGGLHMKSSNPESIVRAAKNTMISAVAVFVVTTVHHVYGAYLYNTPWRIHAAVVSGVATALMAASLWLSRRHQGNAIGSVAWWSFVVIGVVIPFIAFGVFEGAYNHALKDMLYFTHASPELMRQLFPAPTYEMPNNAFFEVTGVMHVIPGFMTGYYLYRVVQRWKKQGRTATKIRAVRAA